MKGKFDVSKKVTKFAASKTFFNFAPCVLQETHVSIPRILNSDGEGGGVGGEDSIHTIFF